MIAELESTGITDPIFGLVAVVVFTVLMTVWALLSAPKRRRAADPLSGLFSSERFEAEIEATERRMTPARPRDTILRGRIDHLSQIRALWGAETRADASEKVAQVIRAGVRKGDRVTQHEGPDGEASFVILAAGASESEGSAIARRLLQKIGNTRFDPQIDPTPRGIRLSANFGVASRKRGETMAQWHARAAAALDGATRASHQSGGRSGEEHVITASQWEEVVLLPPPEQISASEMQDREGQDQERPDQPGVEADAKAARSRQEKAA